MIFGKVVIALMIQDLPSPINPLVPEPTSKPHRLLLQAFRTLDPIPEPKKAPTPDVPLKMELATGMDAMGLMELMAPRENVLRESTRTVTVPVFATMKMAHVTQMAAKG